MKHPSRPGLAHEESPEIGSVAPDGSSVDLYLQFPPSKQPGVLLKVLPAGASVLDLGCGVGRIAEPLMKAGHAVVGVDECRAMLDHCEFETIDSKIEDLDLDVTFDAVILSSYLINNPDQKVRRELLDTCRRHVRPGGVVLIQKQSDWSEMHERSSTKGDISFEVLNVHGEPRGICYATLRYTIGGRTWTENTVTRDLSVEDLLEEISSAGLSQLRFLDVSNTWFSCVPSSLD